VAHSRTSIKVTNQQWELCASWWSRSIRSLWMVDHDNFLGEGRSLFVESDASGGYILLDTQCNYSRNTNRQVITLCLQNSYPPGLHCRSRKAHLHTLIPPPNGKLCQHILLWTRIPFSTWSATESTWQAQTTHWMHHPQSMLPQITCILLISMDIPRMQMWNWWILNKSLALPLTENRDVACSTMQPLYHPS